MIQVFIINFKFDILVFYKFLFTANAQNAEFRKKEADIEEYEVWKARILSEAMNEILQREMEQE